MTQHNKSTANSLLKVNYASAIIIGGFVLGLMAVCVIIFSIANWQLSGSYLPHIMPILMAIISFFAAGYSVVCIVTSRFFQSIAYKKPNYSYLEY